MKIKNTILMHALLITILIVLTGCQNNNVTTNDNNTTATNENDNVETEVPDQGITITVNQYDIQLPPMTEIEEKWFDVTTLYADVPNTFVGTIIPEGWTVEVDGQQLSSGQAIKVNIEHMGRNIGIPIIVSNSNGDSSTCYVRTLNWDIPDIDYYSNPEVDPGVYYTVIMGWLVKYDNKKQEYIYWKDVESNCFDFKRTEIDGEVFYSYVAVQNTEERPTYNTEAGYNYSSLYVMDEEYNKIDEVSSLSMDGILSEKWPIEAHDHLVLGKNHYLLLGYIPQYVNNIPDDLPHSDYGTRVLSAVIQEVKDGELLWEWCSAEHPEFYRMCIEYNDWNNSVIQWNDYMHINSMEIDPKNSNIVCSARHLNTVFEINKETKETEWILGGRLDQFGLDDNQKFVRQHFAKFTKSGDLVLFDNETSWVSSGYPSVEEADVGTGIPRVLKFKLDTDNKTVEEFHEYDMGVKTGEFMGSAQETGDETYLIGWGGSGLVSNNALFTETDFKNTKILFEAVNTAKKTMSTYRVYKYAK